MGELLWEFLNIEISKTIVVGDYYKDIQILKTAGHGVAVANAVDEAKEADGLVTVSNDEHAIAKNYK